MASIGPLSPGTVVDSADVGTVSWSNPDNAKVSDNTYAVNVLSYNLSHYLKATNFGFSIPSWATIDGIKVEVEGKVNTVGNKVISCKLQKNNSGVGSIKINSNISTEDAYHDFGSSSDMWGESWSPSDINNSGFGVSYLFNSSTFGVIVYIDHIRITVYYTEATPTPKPLPTFFRP
jgi:hypothetical protein